MHSFESSYLSFNLIAVISLLLHGKQLKKGKKQNKIKKPQKTVSMLPR